ncbi:hypothetical protein BJX96DRAFT_144108 [Aspergillus floccosus]
MFMVSIYAQAIRVLVWLGEGTDGGGVALEAIRALAENRIFEEQPSSGPEISPDYQFCVDLLQRSWFRRIWKWVLREISPSYVVPSRSAATSSVKELTP